MLILMKPEHTAEMVIDLAQYIRSQGYLPHVIPGEHSVAVGITGNSSALDPQNYVQFAGVKEAIAVTKPYKLASRAFKPVDTEIRVGDRGQVVFGPGRFVVIAGPCAVESLDQTLRIAHLVKAAGADVLRGGAFKPRSSPYSFQGLGLQGLKILAEAREQTGLPIVSEALDSKSLEQVNEYADIIQIGARNMQNFTLLQEAGRLRKPILLKRGMSATLDEWLMAAEYLMDQGNPQIILCERGVRSFDTHARNMLDLTAVPTLRSLSHLPVAVDPSHGTGKRDCVLPLARGSMAVGSNAVMVDVHDRPKEALCDGAQALLPNQFLKMVQELRLIALAMGLKMSGPIADSLK